MKAFVPSGNSLKRTPPNERVDIQGRDKDSFVEDDDDDIGNEVAPTVFRTDSYLTDNKKPL